MINLISSFLELITPIIHFIVKKIDIQDPVFKEANYSEILHVKLQSLIEKTNCDRVTLFKFHNGGHYYTGEPSQKFSAAMEASKQNAPHVAQQRKDFLISTYYRFVLKLLEDGCFYLRGTGSSRECHCSTVGGDICQTPCNMFGFFKNDGAASAYAVPMKHLNGRLIGFLLIEYLSKNEQDIRVHDEFIKDTVNTISGYIIQNTTHIEKKMNMALFFIVSFIGLTLVQNIVFILIYGSEFLAKLLVFLNLN